MLKNKVETELTKEENDYYKFLFFGFFSIILLFSLLLVFIPKKEISVTEKRTLEKFPKIELEALSSGTYYNNLEKYFSDHFIFREFLIKFNNNKNYFLGKRKINSTYIGKFRKSLYEEFIAIDPRKVFGLEMSNGLCVKRSSSARAIRSG